MRMGADLGEQIAVGFRHRSQLKAYFSDATIAGEVLGGGGGCQAEPAEAARGPAGVPGRCPSGATVARRPPAGVRGRGRRSRRFERVEHVLEDAVRPRTRPREGDARPAGQTLGAHVAEAPAAERAPTRWRAEVAEHRLAGASQHHVGGLDVAVDVASGVHSRERRAERPEPALDGDQHRTIVFHHPALERAAAQPLHHDQAPRQIRVEDPHDSGTRELHGEAGLALQLVTLLVGLVIDLERHAPTEHVVESPRTPCPRHRVRPRRRCAATFPGRKRAAPSARRWPPRPWAPRRPASVASARDARARRARRCHAPARARQGRAPARDLRARHGVRRQDQRRRAAHAVQQLERRVGLATRKEELRRRRAQAFVGPMRAMGREHPGDRRSFLDAALRPGKGREREGDIDGFTEPERLEWISSRRDATSAGASGSGACFAGFSLDRRR